MSEQFTDLGKWIKQLLDVIIVQPDDALFHKRYEESIHKDFDFRMNDETYPRDDWREQLVLSRAKRSNVIKSCKELLTNSSGLGGSVSLISTYSSTIKATGETTHGSFVTIATVIEQDGKRVVTRMSEVMD